MNRKRLLLDINSLVPYFTIGHATGVGRSTCELVKALSKFEKLPFDLILYTQNIKGIGVKNLITPFRKLHFYAPRRSPYTGIINALHLKKIASSYDLMHIPHNTDKWEILGKTIYTIHDLIVYRYPEMWGLTEHERQEHKRIAQGCKAIVTCSEASKKDIIEFWGCPPEKVTVIAWGVNREIFFPEETVRPIIPGLNKEYFFSSSCNHPRKQTTLILEAFSEYLSKGGTAQLVLISPSEKDIAKYLPMIESGRLIIARGVSDEILRQLYSNAKASIVVSLYEGFGLPVIESLACHTQVICARNSSLVEAGGNVVDYIDDVSASSLCEKLLKYEGLEKRQTIDVIAAETHLANFTWHKCANEYISFWQKILND